jgi:hypothetical protein
MNDPDLNWKENDLMVDENGNVVLKVLMAVMV